jgi:hypothetical protein
VSRARILLVAAAALPCLAFSVVLILLLYLLLIVLVGGIVVWGLVEAINHILLCSLRQPFPFLSHPAAAKLILIEEIVARSRANPTTVFSRVRFPQFRERRRKTQKYHF